MVVVGLHLRLYSSFWELFELARRLQLPVFQCFLLRHVGRSGTRHFSQDQSSIRKVRQQFGSLFLHASYCVNLAGMRDAHPVLEREIEQVKRLLFTHVVLHAGSTDVGCSREQGIEQVARALNRFLNRKHDDSEITFVLENSPFGGRSIGGSLEELAQIRDRLDKPEKLKFCIDTAHAYAYGYDLRNSVLFDQFIQDAEQLLSRESIVLLHLNDTYSTCGSQQDLHALPGAGNLGEDVLTKVGMQAEWSSMPMILEIPPVDEASQMMIVRDVQSWFRGDEVE